VIQEWLFAHLRAFAAASHRLRVRPLETALNVLTIATALALPISAYVLLENLRTAAGSFGAEPQLSIFLKPAATAGDRSRLERRFNGESQVRAYKLVTREQALQELTVATGGTEVLAGLGANPLPDSYVLVLNTRDKNRIALLRDGIRSEPGVASVETDTAWLEKLDAIVSAGEILALVVGTLLGFAMLAGIINTIRLQVLTGRDEIEVSSLFGASQAFLRRPFLYFGVLEALLGALLAWAIVDGLALLLDTRLHSALGAFSFAQRLRGLDWKDGLSMLAFAGGLGWLGAFISVSQQLRGAQAGRH
jgi:cell division transport system permease protein